MRILLRHAGIALVALTLLACASHRAPAPRLAAAIPPVPGQARTVFTFRVNDVSVGTGATVEPRKCLFVHYTGWLTDGVKFDSSRDTTADGQPRPPLAFPQGARRVIAGWDAGFEDMKVGGKRRLFIPYQLAYGPAGRPPVIPPRSELIFDVELMAVADTLPNPSGRPGPGAPPPQCPRWADVQATSSR